MFKFIQSLFSKLFSKPEKETLHLRHKLNIQFFGEGDEPGGGDPTDPGIPNPLLSGNEPPANPEPTEPTNPEPVEIDFGGRKISVSDPQVLEALQGLQGDWKEQQRTLQNYQQQAQQAQQMFQMMQQQSQMQQPAQPQVPQGPTPERLAEIHEKYTEMSYENIIEATKWLHSQPEYQAILKESISPVVNPLLEPITKEREIANEVNRMAQTYNDFGQFIEPIQQLINQNPQLAEQPNALENLYYRVKADALQQSIASQPTPEQLLQDPNFIAQITQNEQIRNQIISQHMTNKTGNTPPPVMGNTPGGASPNLPANTPKTLAEGSRLFLQHLGMGNG